MNNLSMEFELTLINLNSLISEPKSPFHSPSKSLPLEKILELQDSAIQVINETLKDPLILINKDIERRKTSTLSNRNKQNKRSSQLMENFLEKMKECYQKKEDLMVVSSPKQNVPRNRQKLINDFKTEQKLSIDATSVKPKKKMDFESNKTEIPMPFWLKQMNSVDFNVLGDIILMNKEEKSESKLKKKPRKKNKNYNKKN